MGRASQVRVTATSPRSGLVVHQGTGDGHLGGLTRGHGKRSAPNVHAGPSSAGAEETNAVPGAARACSQVERENPMRVRPTVEAFPETFNRRVGRGRPGVGREPGGNESRPDNFGQLGFEAI